MGKEKKTHCEAAESRLDYQATMNRTENTSGYTLHPSATSTCQARQYLSPGSSVSIKPKYEGREPCLQYTYSPTLSPRCLITVVAINIWLCQDGFHTRLFSTCSKLQSFSDRSGTHIVSLCRFKPDFSWHKRRKHLCLVLASWKLSLTDTYKM